MHSIEPILDEIASFNAEYRAGSVASMRGLDIDGSQSRMSASFASSAFSSPIRRRVAHARLSWRPFPGRAQLRSRCLTEKAHIGLTGAKQRGADISRREVRDGSIFEKPYRTRASSEPDRQPS